MFACRRSKTMRIAVIGAGILGASTAYHAARAGAEVVIVDHAHAGQATAAGAGIVCPWTSETEDPDFYRILAASGAYYAELLPALAGQEFGYSRVGAVVGRHLTARLRQTHNQWLGERLSISFQHVT